MARTTKRYGSLVSLVLSSLVAVAPAIAVAADPEPGESAGPARPTPPPGDVVAPTEAAEAASTPVSAPPPPAPPPPMAGPVFDPKVAVGAWLRTGFRFENPSDAGKLNDILMDLIYLVIAARGQFTPWLKWQASLAATHYTPPGSVTLDAELQYPNAGLQDLIIKFEPHDAFNIWAGKMIVPLDRANLSGPWFTNYWLMRGSFPRREALTPAPYGIKSGPFGRDQGATIWGQFLGGRLKYYGGAFSLDNQSMDAHPMFVGRAVVNFLDPEPGYYNQSAYHGEKDIFAIGGGIQYQKGGSVLVIPAANPALEVGDLRVIVADLLVDKKLGNHVLTLDGNAYFADDFQPLKRLYLVGVGYVSPPVGPGRIAPAARLQIGTVPQVWDPVAMTGIREVGLDREFVQVDGYVQYLVKSHFAKILVGGFYTKTSYKSGAPGFVAKGVQIGLQLIAL